ncbi:MAG: GNAT family N-acetyltransferase [Vicinamibacterales bacterium]
MTPARRQAPHVDDIRALLHRDPWWSAYALGDLDPRRQQYCEWYVREASVALLYREFDAPILWAAGDPGVLDDLPDLRDCYLQVPEAFLAAVERRFTVDGIRPVHRMGLYPADFQPAPGTSVVEPLDESHEHEIRELYADGNATHEAPDFFWRSQLGDGTFFGVRHQGQLVAAGGTHLYSAEESVGAVGNVYTHRSHRGRGHASAITTAVANLLIERGTDTVVLNVRRENEPAIRVYERLGFRFHSSFREGRARGR